MSLPILAHLVRDRAAELGDATILTFVDVDRQGNYTEETRSYRELWSRGQALAGWLANRGLAKGDRFAVMMANHPEFVDLMVASSILGTVFVPLDPRSRGDKLRFMLEFADCRGVFAGLEALPAIDELWGGGRTEGRFVVAVAPIDPQYGLDDIPGIIAAHDAATDLPIASTDPRAPMQVLYTSGTTGDPKAIVTDHTKLFAGGGLMALLGLTAADRPYTGLSLTHANAQVISLGLMLVNGLPGVISRRFTKSRLWDITRRYGCTLFNLLGGMTTAVYAEPRRPDDADNPVRLVLSAGMPAAIWEDFSRRFDVRIVEFYGAAEGGLTINPGNGPVGSCGRPLPNLQLAIFDDHGQPCAPGVAGEICFRNADGSCPPLEYMNDPAATAGKLADGWLHMGDVGHVDADGWLFFHYRKGGGIRRNGDFVNTATVEKALADLECIDDVYVYGVPLPGMAAGEKEVVAAIVPSKSDRFDPQAVFTACAARLDANAVPRFLQVLPEIPKTASEKPLERVMLGSFAVDAGNVHIQR
jgi:crotonobetaine/carnitine-CoA ligase